MAEYRKKVISVKLAFAGVWMVIALLLFTPAIGDEGDEKIELDDGEMMATPSLRVLVVNSYHPGWLLEEDLLSGIVEGLHREGFAPSLDYELLTFWMDTKVNYTSPEEIEARGDMAIGMIEKWKPDIVYVNNDNALEHVAIAYLEAHPESDLPFIFAGTNIDPSVYSPIGDLAHPNRTITGTLERIPYEGIFEEAKKVFPNATRILLISDASPSSVDSKKEFQEWYSVHENDSDLEVLDFVQTNSFEEWKAAVSEYQNGTDLLGIQAYQDIRDEKGELVPPAEVARWTIGNSSIPEVGMISSNVQDGMLMGVGVSYWKTGIYGGIIGGEVLKGRSPRRFPIVDPGFVQLSFNLERSAMLNLTIPVSSLVRADEVYG